jgi:hypothetical protein
MAQRDYEKAAQRFLFAARRVTKGLRLQKERIEWEAEHAPEVLPGYEIQVRVLDSDKSTDIDYYVYELARLEDIGKSVIKVFGGPSQLVDAQAAFNEAIPLLRRARNPLTHPNDNDEMEGFMWFSSLVMNDGYGNPQNLVDPRYEQHQAAMAYSKALTDYLSGVIKQAIEDDPPQSLAKQISERNARWRAEGRLPAD